MNAAPVLPSKTLLSLDADCLGEVLSWLTLDELAIVSRTCKRLNRIAGDVFQTNYKGITITATPEGIFAMNNRNEGVQMTGLENFIENLIFTLGLQFNIPLIFRDLDLVAAQRIAPECKSLKQLHFSNYNLNPPLVRCVEGMMKNVHTLLIHNSAVHPDVNETIPMLCTNLKRLIVSEMRIQDVRPWLQRHYPGLEHLEWVPWIHSRITIPGLRTFFDLNPSVRSFATSFMCLQQNGQLLLDSNAELDDLIVKFDFYGADNHKQLCKLMNTLYERGKFKRLHIGLSILSQTTVDEFQKLPLLESLHIGVARGVDLLQLTNLKDLWLQRIDYLHDAKLHSTKLVNLERIQVRDASIDDVMPFICHSTKLTKLKITQLKPGKHFDGQFLDLVALNRERKRLDGARKLAIYVSDSVFVATRYAVNETDLDRIKMRRTESVQLENYLPQNLRILNEFGRY